MPFIHVQMASGRTEEQKLDLMNKITEVTSEALSTPVESVRVWITEFPATDAMAGGERLSDKKAREARSMAGRDG